MMRYTLALAFLALLPAALATISIIGPSASSYWVEFSNNTITWTFNAGDPTPVDIVVINPDSATLNGAFFAARFVDVSVETVTVTDVTLNVGSNYQVEFVNPSNASQVYATSNTFDVKPNGTAPAPTASAPVSSSTSASGSSSASLPSGTSPSGSSSGAPAPSNTTSGVPRSYATADIFGILVACGVASLAALVL